MPGGRLTSTDRRRIAEGLGEGLGFAEIGRRLERPTSTISREVERNGGRKGYRAELAQRDTGRRAHRAAPVPASAKPGSHGSYNRDEAAVRAFQQRFTETMIETGMPPITAKVLVSLLIADDRYLTSADLVGRLGVSPASVSKSVGYLEALGMVRRERDPARRRERYLVDGDDGWHRAWSRSVELHDRWASVAGEGAGILGRYTPAGARIAEMTEFLEHIRDVLARETERWLAQRSQRRSAERECRCRH